MKKIVVLGPESTGKSTLCQQLATHYKTLCCPEYAREYLGRYGTNYTYDDLLTIAKGQVALEDAYVQQLSNAETAGPNHGEDRKNRTLADSVQNPLNLIFVDTDQHVMKVWCEFVFGKCHQYILDQVAVRKYDLYLLCNVDLPWTKDEMREYPDLERRQQLYHIYRELLEQQSVPWVNISGLGTQRLQNAVDAIDAML